MRLRTGKIITAGTTPFVSEFDTTMAKLDQVVNEMDRYITDLSRPKDTDTIQSSVIPTATVDPASQKIKIHCKHTDQKSTATIPVLQALVNSAQNCSTIEKMMKISLIYDIMLADTNFCRKPSNATFMKVACKEASKHLESIKSDEFRSKLVSVQLVEHHKHFYCILEKFIDGTFGKPADYDEYSYHYDIMKKIGYENAQNKRTEIFNYAHSVDYDEFLIRDYIMNEITVYELYAMVTYNIYEALPNFIDYDYCFETVISWFITRE